MNNAISKNNWLEQNQRYLTVSLNKVRKTLRQYTERSQDKPKVTGTDEEIEQTLSDVCNQMSTPPALETLCKVFRLSPFERDILLLCAGMELDSQFLSICVNAQGDFHKAYPTFSLALAALPEAHWSALIPTAPLRYWRLIEVGSGNTLTLSPLRIDERILHYLAGIRHPDERLSGIIEPFSISSEEIHLVPSHHELAEQISRAWSKNSGTSSLPVVQLCGNEATGKKAIAASACNILGLYLYMISVSTIPTVPNELNTLVRLWNREAALSNSTLLLDYDGMDTIDGAREKAVHNFVENIRGALIVITNERRRICHRQMITLDVCKPTANEQYVVWQEALGSEAGKFNGQVEVLVSQFNLSASSIHAACTEARWASGIEDRGSEIENHDEGKRGQYNVHFSVMNPRILWDACARQSRPRLDNLTQRIEPAASWDDLVLPAAQCQTLHEIATHVRQRMKVYETWGFASKSNRGLGISVLFAGASGTGKTMAAEVLANELCLDLYKIDLSQVVSKYIGETEKNLSRIFDAAEEGGAILFFDEADALFGKRSEVKDSHDRYANIEVSYLLQRMESYRGLAILTTNMKNALDPAFLRRIRFVVQFPFPDAGQRADIWKRIFPAGTPVGGLDIHKLARLNITGGNISNIALNSAFLAADAGEPVRMKHVLHAARTEYAKLERTLTVAEIGGWE